MDSKSGDPPTSYDSDPAPPPSYAESESADPSSSSTSQYYSSQIQHQLRDITTTISSLQTQKSLLSHAQDEKVLSLLTLHIQTYLSDFAKTGLQKGTLILVPRKGLEDEHALPSRYDFKNPKEYDRVVRVGDKEDADINRSSDREFGFGSAADEREGEGKAELWYWRDEKMARRLAGYLRPKQDPRTAQKEELKAQQQLQQRQQAEASSSSSSPSTSRSSFWGVRKLSAKIADKAPMYINSEDFAPLPVRDSQRDRDRDRDVKSEPAKVEDRVVLDVKAEEVVFRTENDFGIYETRSGWSIVLELRVIL